MRVIPSNPSIINPKMSCLVFALALSACGGGSDGTSEGAWSGSTAALEAAGPSNLEGYDSDQMLIEEAAGRRDWWRNRWQWDRDRNGNNSPSPSPAPTSPSAPSAPPPVAEAPSPSPAPSAPPPATAPSPTNPPQAAPAPVESSPVAAAADPKYFATVKGWANTQGGKGGRIIKVTNLSASGPGSLRAALDEKGPRIIVFETSGNIDLGGNVLNINEPYVTIAGQTAPSPGITIIRGGIVTYTHDIIVQHLKIRPGTGAGSVADALETQRGSYNVIVDHCSLSWGTDEVLSAAGFAFRGSNLTEWRAATSNRITFSNNIVAEALTSGGQGYGSLIEDNATQILLYGNLWAHNKERSPNFGGATQGAVINNMIYNPGGKFLDYTFANWKWDAEGRGLRANGKITAIGNVGQAGPSTNANAFFETVSNGDVEYYAADNVARRRDGSSYPATVMSNYLNNPQGKILMQSSPPVSPPGVSAMSSSAVEQHVLAYAGARPWDRDAHDQRVLRDVRNRTGKMIGSQSDVGGYPPNVVNVRPFNPAHWDLNTMTPTSAQAL